MNATKIYRFVLICALAYVLLALVRNGIGFSSLLVPHSAAASRHHDKMSASALEAALSQGGVFTPANHLLCKAAAEPWDYVCSYMPTPAQSTTQVQFGVNVHATWWDETSPRVPIGADIPPPKPRRF